MPARPGGTRSVASVLWSWFWDAATRDRGPPWGFPLEGRAPSRPLGARRKPAPWESAGAFFPAMTEHGPPLDGGSPRGLEGRAPSRPSCGCGFGLRPRGTVALHGVFLWRDALCRVRPGVAVLGCGHEGPWPSTGFSLGGTRSVASVLWSWFWVAATRDRGPPRGVTGFRGGGLPPRGPGPGLESPCRSPGRQRKSASESR